MIAGVASALLALYVIGELMVVLLCCATGSIALIYGTGALVFLL